MLPLFFFALVIHAAFSSAPCQDGVEIRSQETNNPADVIGKWNYVYHWDTTVKTDKDFLDSPHPNCPHIIISPATPDFIKSKEAVCAKTKVPFKWSDIVLKVDAPEMKMEGGILVIGKEGNWMTDDCNKMVRVVIKKYGDYVVMSNPDLKDTTELLARATPSMEELKCVAHNIDAGKGMKGVGICYRK